MRIQRDESAHSHCAICQISRGLAAKLFGRPRIQHPDTDEDASREIGLTSPRIRKNNRPRIGIGITKLQLYTILDNRELTFWTICEGRDDVALLVKIRS